MLRSNDSRTVAEAGRRSPPSVDFAGLSRDISRQILDFALPAHDVERGEQLAGRVRWIRALGVSPARASSAHELDTLGAVIAGMLEARATRAQPRLTYRPSGLPEHRLLV